MSQTPSNSQDSIDNAFDGQYKLEAEAGFFAKLPETPDMPDDTYILAVLKDGVGWHIYEVNGNPYDSEGAVGTLQKVSSLMWTPNPDVVFSYCGKSFVFGTSRCTCDKVEMEVLNMEQFDGFLNEDGTRVRITPDPDAKQS